MIFKEYLEKKIAELNQKSGCNIEEYLKDMGYTFSGNYCGPDGKQYVGSDGKSVLIIKYIEPIDISLEFPLNEGVTTVYDGRKIEFYSKGKIDFIDNEICYYTHDTLQKIHKYNLGEINEIQYPDRVDFVTDKDPIVRINEVQTWANSIQLDNGYKRRKGQH